MDDIRIQTIQPRHAAALEQLQRDCFPTLAAGELMNAQHFLNHCRLFPEGNFVALADERVVGLGSGFLIDFDLDDAQHSYQEIIDGGWYSQHDPAGDWYYGSDISVHPEYRRRGIGSRLYAARKGIVQRLNRRGIVAGGLIPGFADYKHAMTPQNYVDKVVQGQLRDNTLSFQLGRGFEVRGLLRDYIEDAASDNWATLIVWQNPEYRAG
ncbi:MAG: GNAT family N-acetyltransferase [Chloroflexi bacterium]|nr:GNAT family N-acetyltransferase [Chloroflexota bacterium]MCY3714975.1 GNAT family N-acetyltransferase [Chloroflexota bacterium]MDE2651853.1 GNAT family N-acetyltransferase [Chloroflexota bacterium]MXV92627.1 GNAT family N-acetyltransferase [Chloroflexota bacterium]MXX52355.1 GNAT family N-acetyltransferase [Chloroflexota bacterium]